jgi:hypothetical protein
MCNKTLGTPIEASFFVNANISSQSQSGMILQFRHMGGSRFVHPHIWPQGLRCLACCGEKDRHRMEVLGARSDHSRRAETHRSSKRTLKSIPNPCAFQRQARSQRRANRSSMPGARSRGSMRHASRSRGRFAVAVETVKHRQQRHEQEGHHHAANHDDGQRPLGLRADAGR